MRRLGFFLSLHMSFQVSGSTYLDLLRRPYRFLLLRDRSLLGGGFGVTALGLNFFAAEAEPATVAAPAVPSLNVPTYIFLDIRAQSDLFPYIQNILP